MKIIDVIHYPEFKEKIIEYFLSHWASDESKMVYVDAINNAKIDKMNNWYALLDDDQIIGGVGLISNDFVSRMDLYPYLCALYINENYRGKNLGELLINKVKQDVLNMGYDYLYLLTDHDGYYEHFGFKHIGTGYHPWGETSKLYKALLNQNKYELLNNVKSLIDTTLPLTSNLANISRLLKDGFKGVSWAGFYLSNQARDMLYLSCYQGPLACGKIPFNKGVCGKAAFTKKSILVDNVHEFPGHIACSSLTNSEVVVPIIKDNNVLGVIDLDSNEFNNFSLEDVEILESVAKEIAKLF